MKKSLCICIDWIASGIIVSLLQAKYIDNHEFLYFCWSNQIQCMLKFVNKITTFEIVETGYGEQMMKTEKQKKKQKKKKNSSSNRKQPKQEINSDFLDSILSHAWLLHVTLFTTTGRARKLCWNATRVMLFTWIDYYVWMHNFCIYSVHCICLHCTPIERSAIRFLVFYLSDIARLICVKPNIQLISSTLKYDWW